MNKINCIDTLSPVTWYLTREGLFPAKRYTYLHLIKLLINLLFYSLIVNILTLNLIKAISTKNVVLFNKVTTIFLPILNILAKALAILVNRASFLSILEDLKSATFNNHSESNNNYIQIVDRLSKMMLKVFIVSSVIYIFMTSILPVVTNLTLMIPPPIYMGKYSLLYKFVHLLMAIYLGCN